MKKNYVIIPLISIIAIFSQPIFFSLSGLFGYRYLGAEESNIFVFYIVLVFVAILITYLFSFIKKRTVNRIELYFYFFFIFLFINHFVWVILDSETRLINENLIFFILFGIGGFFAARVIDAFDAWKDIIRLTEIIMIILSVGLILEVFQSLIAGEGFIGIGGASYQAGSYYSALFYGIIGISTFRLEKDYRYSFCRTKLIFFLNISLMSLLFVATIFNGGRGAFVLLISYSFLIIYWFIINLKLKKFSMINFFGIITVLLTLSYTFLNYIDNSLITKGFNRATNFLKSEDGSLINLATGSSGRDIVYSETIEWIFKSPLFGFGVFDHWGKTRQPHNIFFDLFLQFGIPIGIVVLLIFTTLFLIRLKPMNSVKLWLLTLSLYPLIVLNVSNGYLRFPLFWFVLFGFLFASSRSRIVENSLKFKS